MPKTKTQGIVFGILMSFFMAYGMEVYNTSIRMGFNLAKGLGFSAISYAVFWEALKESIFMTVIVYIVSDLIGNRAGAAFMKRHCDPEKDNPYFCRLMRQAGTVQVMCPLMSLAATLLFKDAGNQMIAVWFQTTVFNFPMAFFWQLCFAGPFVRKVFGLLFREK